MATVTSQAATVPGIALTMSAASGGGDVVTIDQSLNGVWLLIVTAGTPTTITMVTPNTVNGLAVADNTKTTESTGLTWLWMPASLYADANSQCAISWSAATSVTFAVLR
jgi:hypothetical protein